MFPSRACAIELAAMCKHLNLGHPRAIQRVTRSSAAVFRSPVAASAIARVARYSPVQDGYTSIGLFSEVRATASSDLPV